MLYSRCGILILLVAGTILPQKLCAQANRKAGVLIEMKKLIDSANANVGVAMIGLDFKDSLLINEHKHYPMQSVYKFPLALALLSKTDKGQMPLNMNLHIPRERLDADTWSPMVKDHPAGDINISLSELLAYAISKSDNNACDILFSFIGGTQMANRFVDSVGVKGISIKATEAEMKGGWDVQYTNWAEPAAMARLLRAFYEGRLLAKENNELLLKLMTESENSPNRIKGLLPATAVVAHKTGTSNTNDQGITAATNDIGIVSLPDGRHFAAVVFVSDYRGGVAKGEQLIARLSKLAWDYFSK